MNLDAIIDQAFEKQSKARYLTNAQITHVSYVDQPANKKKFFLTKSEGVPGQPNEELTPMESFNKAVEVQNKHLLDIGQKLLNSLEGEK